MALTGKKLINTINLVAALAIFLCVSDLLVTRFVDVDPKAYTALDMTKE